MNKEKKKEIINNIINSGLAGILVFVGSLTAGQITWEGCVASGLAALIIFLTKFKEFWEKFMKIKKGSNPGLGLFEFIKI